MTNTILPKSLHTVTVLANVAGELLNTKPGVGSARVAVKVALRVLGYEGTADPYGLADKAVAVLDKRLAAERDR